MEFKILYKKNKGRTPLNIFKLATKRTSKKEIRALLNEETITSISPEYPPIKHKKLPKKMI